MVYKITKVCEICYISKSIDDFYSQNKKNSKGEDYIYYQPYCKECAKKKSRKWNKENVESYNSASRKFYNNNKDIFREKDARWREKGGLREWQKNNRDKVKQYAKKHSYHDISDSEWLSCKEYFNNECAYCGMHIDNHYITRLGERIKSDLHKEHVDHVGVDDLSNCIPSCRRCNSQKSTFNLYDWYNENNVNFTNERLEKIHKWLKEDNKLYMKKEITKS